MAKYRLKRKTYGVTDAVGNTIGGVAETAGKALDSRPAALVGAAVGASQLGATIGTAVGGPFGTALGYIGGGMLGGALTRGVGKGLKSAGRDMQT